MHDRANSVNKLCHQLLIGEMLSINDATEGMDKDMVVVPIAETPFQFIQVPVKVLGTDLVECSDDASLEQGPKRLLWSWYERHPQPIPQQSG